MYIWCKLQWTRQGGRVCCLRRGSALLDDTETCFVIKKKCIYTIYAGNFFFVLTRMGGIVGTLEPSRGFHKIPKEKRDLSEWFIANINVDFPRTRHVHTCSNRVYGETLQRNRINKFTLRPIRRSSSLSIENISWRRPY